MDYATTPMITGKRLDDVDTLARDSLLASLDSRDRARLVDLLEELRLPVGTRIEATSLDGAYFVLEGRIREAHRTRGAKSREKGDHFGIAALLGAQSSRTSFTAETNVRLALFRTSRFRGLFASHPMLAASLAESIARESIHEVDEPELETVTSQTPTYRARADALLPHEPREPRIVGALLDNRPISLDAVVRSDAAVVPIPIASPEGRDIFLRTVGMLVLEALARVAPDARAQWDSSVGSTQVLRVSGALADDGLARRVADSAQAMIDEHAMLRAETMGIEEARTCFLRQGWADAAALLRLAKSPRSQS